MYECTSWPDFNGFPGKIKVKKKKKKEIHFLLQKSLTSYYWFSVQSYKKINLRAQTVSSNVQKLLCILGKLEKYLRNSAIYLFVVFFFPDVPVFSLCGLLHLKTFQSHSQKDPNGLVSFSCESSGTKSCTTATILSLVFQKSDVCLFVCGCVCVCAHPSGLKQTEQ